MIIRKNGINKLAKITTKNKVISINQLNYKAPEKFRATEELSATITIKNSELLMKTIILPDCKQKLRKNLYWYFDQVRSDILTQYSSTFTVQVPLLCCSNHAKKEEEYLLYIITVVMKISLNRTCFRIFAFWILFSWSSNLIYYGNTFCCCSILQTYYTHHYY
jgi:hypothetical protein